MGYTLQVLCADFGRLMALPGSHDDALLRGLLPVLSEDDDFFREEWQEEQDDAEADGEPRIGEGVVPSTALRRILDGVVTPEEEDPRPYVTALVALYEHLGSEVGQIHFSSGEVRLLSDWDAAMVEAGVPHSFFALSGRGAPFPFPPDEPFPTIGYMTPQEVAQAFRLVNGAPKWPWFWRKRDIATPKMDRATYDMFRSWIAVACHRGQGLVGVLQ